MSLIGKNISEIRVAVAGLGKMGTYHLHALEELALGRPEEYYKGNVRHVLRRLRVCGICDIYQSRLNAFPEIPGFIDFEQMIEKTRPDIVILAVPTGSHKQFALASIGKGIHTFVEKPIVTNLRDLKELIVQSKNAGCKLTAGHVERYNPVTIKMKSLLAASRAIAERYEFVRTQPHDCRITDNIILDKVIHDLDLAICLFGDIAAVNIESIMLKNGQIHEARINLMHASGTSGCIFVSWLTAAERIRKVTVSQGKHLLSGDFAAKQLWLDGNELVCRVDGMVNAANNQLKDELVDFIACCCQQEISAGIMPLLRMEEIEQATSWLEIINLKCGEMTDGRKSSSVNLCAS